MDIEVHMGDIAVIEGPHNLMTCGVGSCLVVTLCDLKRQIGALAHTMLSLSPTQDSEHRTPLSWRSSSENLPGQQACLVAEEVSTKVPDTKYLEVAIDEMLKRMQTQGVEREDLEAKLIGGANMFPSFDSNIGRNNVSSAKKKLKKEGIKIAGECVGGSQGRSVEFSPTTGIVTVKTKF